MLSMVLPDIRYNQTVEIEKNFLNPKDDTGIASKTSSGIFTTITLVCFQPLGDNC